MTVDHVQAALGRLLYQYSGAENLKNIVSALAQQSQDEEDALQAILAAEHIQTATGERLDGWGKILNVPRGTLSDDAYRAKLIMKIYGNYSEGSIENLITIFGFFMDSTDVELSEYFPASISLQANEPGSPDMVSARLAIEICKAAGVEISSLSASYSPAFAFYEYSGGITTAGFDDGSGTVGGTLSTDL